jgi:hypothetical protein
VDAPLLSARALAEALGGERSGDGYMCPCPAHQDDKPSLSIKEGKNGRPVFFCHAKCTQDEVLDALRARGLWPEPRENKPKANKDVPQQTRWARDLWSKAQPIDPAKPHPYFLARGIDTTEFKFLHYTVKVLAQYTHKESGTVGPSIVAPTTLARRGPYSEPS